MPPSGRRGPPVSTEPPATTSFRPVQTTVASVRGDGAFSAAIGVQRWALGSYCAPSPSVRTEPVAPEKRPRHPIKREPVQATAVGASRGDGAPAADIGFQVLRARSSTAPSPSTLIVWAQPPQ